MLLIMIGGLLLTLPTASAQGQFTSLDTTFFTATSAVTVTGHTVVSTATYWSAFGQAVIFLLMLVGGLGFMVVSTFLLLVIGQRATLPERLLTRGLMRDTVGVEQMVGLRRIGRQVVLLVFCLYGLGTILIFWQVHGIDGLEVGRTVWDSLFLSVSAFNNAGLNILPELPDGTSLARFASKPVLLGLVTVLMVLGDLGWTVLVDVYRHRRFARFSLDTKLVIVTSLSLWALGAGVLFLAEFANAETMGGLDWTDKIVGAIFSSASGRTAGFATMDFGQVRDITKMTYTGLMFIGGAAGSVAGGIKVVTFAVIVAAVVSVLRGRHQAEAFGREINRTQLYRALTVAFLGFGLIMVLVPVLATMEPDIPFSHLLFDTVSAFGTTGASTGIVPGISLAARSIIMIAMFVGRLGPVTLALTLTESGDEPLYRFATEGVLIG
ncbi:MAG: TrkH family potassium uptake protein [Dehalococcoidia bacterium]